MWPLLPGWASNVAANEGFDPVSLGWLAFWLANSSVSSGSVPDLSGNGFHAVQSTVGYRPTFATSPNRLVFDGSDDNLEIPFGVCSALSGGSAVSLVIGYKGTNYQSGIRLQPENPNYIISGFGGATPAGIISSDGGTGGGVAIDGLEDNAWHQSVVTWQRNTTNGFKSYVDGVVIDQRTSADVALPTFASSYPPAIGAFRGGGSPGEVITGNVHHAAIASVARTAGEVAALYRWFQGAVA